MDKIKKNINVIVIIIVLVFMGTFIYHQVNEDTGADISEQIIGEGQSEEARQILEVLNELDKIDIDYSFFYNKGEQNGDEVIFVVNKKEYVLRDFSQKELAPKDFGKQNPFYEENISRSISVNNI